MEDHEIATMALRLARREGASDAASTVNTTDWRMIRFTNNGVFVSKTSKGTTLQLFAMVRGSRAMSATTNLSKHYIEEMVRNIVRAARLSPPGEVYVPLPKGPFKYARQLRGVGDAKIDDKRLPQVVQMAIQAALSEGSQRVAGSLIAERTTKFLCTTGGASGHHTSTSYNLNVRAFADPEATGQFAQVATSISKLKSDEVGKKAGRIAKESMHPEQADPGKFDAIFGPMTVADLTEEIGGFASGFYVDAGLSFFVDKLGQKVASDSFTLEDDPTNEEATGSANFDEEGLPTFKKTIIENGVLRTLLHNSNTAKKMGAKSTANAGLVNPSPFNLVVSAGSKSTEELISTVDDGIYVTNNWYLRYQDMRNGDFSTILRDGMFRIKNGQIIKSIRGLRLSDNMLRLFSNIEAVGKDRYWIKWWEVETPTFAPAMLVRGANFTKPTL